MNNKNMNKNTVIANNTLPRIAEVEIKNLFGNKSFKIDFSEKNGISAITGPNGCGKSTILNLIDCLLNPSTKLHDYIISPGFDSFYCTLSNGMAYGMEREFKPFDRESMKEFDSIVDCMLSRNNMRIDYVILNNRTGKEERLDLVKLFSIQSSKTLEETIEMIKQEFTFAADEDMIWQIERIYDEYNPEHIFAGNPYPYKDTDEEGLKYERTHKIQEYLLKMFMLDNGAYLPDGFVTFNAEDRVYGRKGSPLKKYEEGWLYDERCEERIYILESIIENKIKILNDSFSKSYKEMQDTLPERYFGRNKEEISIDDLKKAWETYKDSFRKLSEENLINEIPELFKSEKWEEKFEENKDFIKTYLDGFNGLLDEFNAEYERFRLLADTYDKQNELLERKLKHGIFGVGPTQDGEWLSVDELSPGEKSYLILIISLIYETIEGGIFIIDEPEMFLDEKTQKGFMALLQQECETRNLQALVSTKSSIVTSDVKTINI